MDKSESDFLALKSLLELAMEDPEHMGWYLMQAYFLGAGTISINEVFNPPPEPELKFQLRLVNP